MDKQQALEDKEPIEKKQSEHAERSASWQQFYEQVKRTLQQLRE